MCRRQLLNRRSFSLLAVALVCAVALFAIATRGAAKDTPQNECLASFTEVPAGDENGGTITCNDCDPSCDQDGVNTPNQSCTFKGMGCVNKPSGSCLAAADLKTIKGKVQGGGTITIMKPAANGSACGAFTATVKLKKKGKKAGKATVKLMVKANGKPKRSDKDVLTLICNPQPAATCPTTTTSTVITTTTTTTTIACADCCSGFTMIKTLNGVPDTNVNIGS